MVHLDSCVETTVLCSCFLFVSVWFLFLTGFDFLFCRMWVRSTTESSRCIRMTPWRESSPVWKCWMISIKRLSRPRASSIHRERWSKKSEYHPAPTPLPTLFCAAWDDVFELQQAAHHTSLKLFRWYFAIYFNLNLTYIDNKKFVKTFTGIALPTIT